MVGLWHPELRAEAWVTPVLIPEGWVGRDFIGEGEGGEEPPQPAEASSVVFASSNPGAGYVRIRRKFWWKVV